MGVIEVLITTGIYPPEIGGPATHSSDLVEALRERGHSVAVLTLTDDLRPTAEGGVVRFPRRWPWPVRSSAAVRWIWAHRRRFDVVYATGLAPEALAGARLARIPIVVKIVGDPAWERGVRQGLTALDYDSFQRNGAGGPRLRLMRWLRSRTVRSADAVVTPSRQLARDVTGWGAAHVEVIPNGVRLPTAARPPATGRRGCGEPRTRVVAVSRLVEHKRLDVLIDAAVAAGVELDIVGDGPERDHLQTRVDRAAAERIRVVGPRTHDEVIDLLAAADVLALASTYEGLPHTLIEALSVGTPVVSAPVGGVVDVLHDGYDGLLVDPPTIAGFTDAFTRLRDDPDLRDRLSRGAAETGTAWDFSACVTAVEGVLDRASAGARNAGSAARTRPAVVYLGKTAMPLDPGPDIRRKLALHAHHLDEVSINTGPQGRRRVDGVTVVAIPPLPAPIGSVLFYALGPVLAVVAAVRLGRSGRRSAIVCQSPYEAFGVVLLRGAVPRRRRPRLQIELHGDFATAARLYGRGIRRVLGPLSDQIATWTLRRADRVRVVSGWLEQVARDAGYRGPIDRHLAFTDFASFAEAPTPRPTTPHVLFVGSAHKSKGLDLLLDAWPDVAAAVPDARLVCVGDDSLAGAVADRGGSLGATIRCRGRVPRRELVTLMDDAGCVVAPSRSEGLGLAIIEAMARARPVVAAAVGGITELITDGVDGVLVEAENVIALRDALVAILRDPERATALGVAARRRVLARDPEREYADGIARLAEWISADA